MEENKIPNKKIFLDIAFYDLKASKILYQNSLYPQAVFYFEQSVEKTCKFILIDQNIVNINELNAKIRHNSIIVFKHYTEHMIKRFSSIYNLDDVHDNPGEILYRKIFFPQKLVQSLQKALKEIENQSKLRFKELKQSDFNLFFKMLKYFSNDPYSELKSDHGDFFSSDPEIVLNSILKYLNLDENDRKTLNAKMNEGDFKKDLIINLKDTMISTQELVRNEQILMVLARIFSSHSENTRYPETDLSKNPQTIYNDSNILIKNLKKLYQYQEQALNYFINNGSC